MLTEARHWFHSFDAAASFSGDPLARGLAAAGLGPYPLDGDAPMGPGVVVFAEVTQELCAFVREASAAGAERVLAVAASEAALEQGAAWRLIRAGASDVIPRTRDGATTTAEAAARLERWAAVDRLVDSPRVRNNLVGQGPAWRSLLRQVVEVAAFTDAPVLVTGETGTGKELVARLIHSLDTRERKGNVVLLDCTTTVRELSGSEFFGHERGAYTGADRGRDGAFALADGGTLFLDEVGELPLSLQPQLLRVIQEGTYKRVGGNAWLQTRFRLVSATHRDLPAEVAAGSFRADLFYRLATVTCRMPALRDRPEDVIPLFEHFLAAARPDGEAPALEPDVRDFLLRRDYPGNVRDLKQLAARVAYRHTGAGPVTLGSLPDDERHADAAETTAWPDRELEVSVRRAVAQGVGLKEIGRVATETAIRAAVHGEDGNLRRAARRLGVTDRALQLRRRQGRVAIPADHLASAVTG